MKALRTFTLILAFSFLAGCNFYKHFYLEQGKTQNPFGVLLENYITTNRYLVVHQGSETWHLRSPDLNSDKTVLSGLFEKPPARYMMLYDKIKGKHTAPCPNSDKPFVEQVHLDVSSVSIEDGLMKIKVQDISKMEVLTRDETASSCGTAGVVVAGIGAGCGLALLSANALCNCPYIYTGDSIPRFEGNLFTGALYPSLERSDNIVIDAPVDLRGNLRFTMFNRREEAIYANQVRLLVVDHPRGVDVLPDQQSVFHTLSHAVAPVYARTAAGVDVSKFMQNEDGRFYSFDDDGESGSMNSVVLTFDNEQGATTGKLLLDLKNSEWQAYVYQQVCGLFGDQYPAWHEKQSKKSGAELTESSRNSGMLLSVYVETARGWKFIDQVFAVGSLRTKEVLVPVDLTGMKAGLVHIMLKTGFHFWDLDRVALDLSPDQKISIDTVSLSSVKDSLGMEYREKLLNNDHSYLELSRMNDHVVLDFTAVPFNDPSTQKLFLNGKGYYSRNEKYSGSMQTKELLRLKREGGLSLYSRRLYNERMKMLTIKNN
ncbi:MAG TPA: hypothetical protein VI112_04940 [Bacteroidia bacterium]|jgi:hypothetical protein